jgi:4-amino-4-deoxy-L-arabinose transferase-like glycosyltransferase
MRYERRKATWGALLAITLVAFLLRASHLDTQSFWRDEVDVIHLANEPLPGSDVGGAFFGRSDGEIYGFLLPLVQRLVRVGYNGPLYFLLMRVWLRLVSDSEFALRFLSLCAGVLTVPLAYRAGRRLVGRPEAVITAILVAISPYLIWYSQDAKMYAMVTALTLLGLTCLLEALAARQLRWWAGFVLFASLSLYVHTLSALMVPVYLAAFILAGPLPLGQWRRGLVAFGLLTLPYLPLLLWQLPLVMDSYDTGHPFYPIDRMFSLLFNLYARGMAMVGSWVVVAGFVFAMLAGLFLSVRGSHQGGHGSRRLPIPGGRRWRLFLLIWLLLPILLVYLISLRAPVFEPRYLIFLTPAFYLLTGLGVVALSRLSWVAAGLVLAAVLTFSLLGVWTQATAPIKSDFRAAADYVTTHRQTDAPVMFQMPYVRHTFDYYFDGEYAALEGPWTNGGASEMEVEGTMGRLLEPYPEVWLVASESWLWDSRDLTRAWLDQHAELRESASFMLVDVYHYSLGIGESGN